MSIRSAVRTTLGALPKCNISTALEGELSLFQLGQRRSSTSVSSRLRTHRMNCTSRVLLTQATVSADPFPTKRFMSSAKGNAEETSAELTPSVLSQAEYERISEEDMETLSENLGALCEQVGREKWEVDYSSGVLTLSIPPHGTYVLNKQPPNQQIWISSPISGPSRFGYVASTPSDPSTTGPMSSESTLGDDESTELKGAWTHFRRQGVTLGGLVEGELRTLGVGKDDAEEWLGVGIK